MLESLRFGDGEQVVDNVDFEGREQTSGNAEMDLFSTESEKESVAGRDNGKGNRDFRSVKTGCDGSRMPRIIFVKVGGETCSIEVGYLRLTDVRLLSVMNGEQSKLLVTPKDGSYVTAIDLSGEMRELERDRAH